MSARASAASVLLLVGGAAILASALLHGAVNVPHLRGDMLEIGVRSSLVGAISLVLYFSVVAMFAFAGLVLAGGVASLVGRAPHRAALWLVAGCYIAFGIVAYALVDANAHFLGYAGMGLVVALGALLTPRNAGAGPAGQ